MKKKISFIPKTEIAQYAVPRPEPAKNYTPSWFKKIPSFEHGKPKMANDESLSTVKMCMPFSDTFNMGYIQESWSDFIVEKDENSDEIFYRWAAEPELAQHRQKASVLIDDSFYQTEFSWKSQWAPKLPDGYSCLVTHPLNHLDLPFVTLSGVVDSDKFFHESAGNHPFYLKKGFTGLIPKGTPLFQIIPFKRDSWESSAEEFTNEIKYLQLKIRQQFWGAYKKQFWTKKSFK